MNMKKVKFLLATMVLAALAFGFNACSNTDDPDPTTIAFTSVESVSVPVSGSANFDVTVKVAGGSGATTFNFAGLPSWVTKEEGTDKVTLKITAPAAEGDFPVTITATNNNVSATQNFTIKVGGSVIGGEGTETNPYGVPSAMANQDGTSKWVQGYIVGYIKTTGEQNEWIFSATGCDNKTNLILAASATETDKSKCLNVQLPSGAVRNGLNLVDNPTVLGKEVLMYGTLELYFPPAAGLKNVSYAKLIESGTEFGTKPIDTSNAIFNETLLTQTSFDKFFAVNVAGDLGWKFDPTYGAVMSGYDTQTHANEDWFISPVINLDGKSNVVIIFNHARGPAGSMSVPTSNYTLWVSTDYTSGLPSTATWTQLTIPTHGTTAWGYVSSGEIAIPADKLTATTRIAFKYWCNDSESATWEINNVVIK